MTVEEQDEQNCFYLHKSTFKLPCNEISEDLIFYTKEDGTKHLNIYNLAFQIVERNYIRTLAYENSDNITFYYKDKKKNIFIPSGLIIIEQEIFRVSEKHKISVSITKKNKIIETIKLTTTITEDFFSEYNKEHIDIVNFNNGCLNIKTMKFMPHNFDFSKYSDSESTILYTEYLKFHEEFHFRTFIDVEYRPELTETSKFETEFLPEVLPDMLDRDSIFEMIGYYIYRSCPLDTLDFFVGEGNNGKTALLLIIFEFLNGTINSSMINFEEFSTQRFSKIEAYLKLLICQGDLDTPVIERVGFLKDFASGMVIYTDRKNKGGINFKSYAKGLFSCNHTPRTKNPKDNNKAFQRRLHLIKFKKEIPKEKIRNRDELVQEYSTDEEKTLILNRAIEGLHRLLKNKQYSNWISTERTATEFEISHNSARYYTGKIIDHNTENENYIYEKDLYKNYYLKWCGKQESIKESFDVFKYELETQHPTMKLTRKRAIVKKGEDKGKKRFHYKGIDIIDDKIYTVDNIEINTGIGTNTILDLETPGEITLKSRIIRILENNDILSTDEIIKILGAEVKYLDKLNVDENISTMIQNGDIYEPKPGIFKRIE